MSLYIRSQDKLRLTKCDDIRIYYCKEHDMWVIEDCDDLGEYKTKERAILILNEIQYLMNSKLIVQELFPSSRKLFEAEEIRMNYKYPENNFIFVHDGFEVKKFSEDIIYEMPMV